MNAPSIIALLIVAALAGLSVRNLIKNKRKGGCAGCSHCSGCPSCHLTERQK